MHKIWLIIKREYLVRVRKKAFIVMTIVGPLLMAALLIVPTYLAEESQELRNIAIEEDGFEFTNQLEDTEFLHFSKIPQEKATLLKEGFTESNYYALLHIEENNFTLYSNQQISLSVSNGIENQLEKIIEHQKLKAAGIDLTILESAESTVNITTKIISEDGNTTNSQAEASMGIGFICGILIYMFIFMYGTMVMRGVIEEKTSRIVEVIISSVKPFQLMMGKILGVALVGLTQFVLWILLTFAIATIAELLFMDASSMTTELNAAQQSVLLSEISSLTGGINLIQIFVSFLFYFLAGYLMYSSLFAAVGSAVDAEADTQQFVLPITIPLILSFILIQPIMENPDGTLAFWMSIIPFTSPVIMMVRLPFGVANWELALSVGILISSFILTTWFAGRIYRTGILMYGKKTSYKELWKWLSYKE
ncbi:MAG: ABC transporter permease [Flavobacteriales bacterium]|nr:ABC transporter permease [Flavobacteriales bacterium]